MPGIDAALSGASERLMLPVLNTIQNAAVESQNGMHTNVLQKRIDGSGIKALGITLAVIIILLCLSLVCCYKMVKNRPPTHQQPILPYTHQSQLDDLQAPPPAYVPNEGIAATTPPKQAPSV